MSRIEELYKQVIETGKIDKKKFMELIRQGLLKVYVIYPGGEERLDFGRVSRHLGSYSQYPVDRGRDRLELRNGTRKSINVTIVPPHPTEYEEPEDWR